MASCLNLSSESLVTTPLISPINSHFHPLRKQFYKLCKIREQQASYFSAASLHRCQTKSLGQSIPFQGLMELGNSCAVLLYSSFRAEHSFGISLLTQHFTYLHVLVLDNWGFLVHFSMLKLCVRVYVSVCAL